MSLPGIFRVFRQYLDEDLQGADDGGGVGRLGPVRGSHGTGICLGGSVAAMFKAIINGGVALATMPYEIERTKEEEAAVRDALAQARVLKGVAVVASAHKLLKTHCLWDPALSSVLNGHVHKLWSFIKEVNGPSVWPPSSMMPSNVIKLLEFINTRTPPPPVPKSGKKAKHKVDAGNGLSPAHGVGGLAPPPPPPPHVSVYVRRAAGLSEGYDKVSDTCLAPLTLDLILVAILEMFIRFGLF